MPQSGTGERVTRVLGSPSRDGLPVQAIRVDYEPGGFTRRTHRLPVNAYVYSSMAGSWPGTASRSC